LLIIETKVLTYWLQCSREAVWAIFVLL